jgi:hypothetical protein
MPARMPKLIDVIICDDIRREANTNKLFIIGMYTGAVVVNSVPAKLPTFSILIKWRAEDDNPVIGTLRIESPSKKVLQSIDIDMSDAPGRKPDWAEDFHLAVMINARDFKFPELGRYRFMFKPPEGRARKLATFSVIQGEVSPSLG